MTKREVVSNIVIDEDNIRILNDNGEIRLRYLRRTDFNVLPMKILLLMILLLNHINVRHDISVIV